MTTAAEIADIAREAVAEMRAAHDRYRSDLLAPLAVLENLPEPVVAPVAPTYGASGELTLTSVSVKTSGANNMRFEGWVDVVGPVARFVNCEFVGPASYPTVRPLVKCTDPGILYASFENCTFAAQTPGPDEVDGIVGKSFHLFHCDLHHVDDGVGLHGPGWVTVEQSWIHDLVKFTTGTQHADGSHNDAIQVHNGGRLAVIRSKLDAYLTDGNRSMSAIMLSPAPTSGGYLDLLLADSEVNGGQVGLNFGRWVNPTGERRIVGNRWGTDVTTPILAKRDLPLQIAGNTQGGQPRNDRRNG